MAQASSSKMTLDAVGVLLAASLASHSPYRQTNTQQQHVESTAKEDQADDEDYDSEGFCTPPLPPMEGAEEDAAINGLTLDDQHQKEVPSNVIAPSSSSDQAPSQQIPDTNGVDHHSPRAKKMTRKEYDDADYEPERLIVFKAEYIDPLEEIEVAAPACIATTEPKRGRGRPPGVKNSNKKAPSTGKRTGRPVGRPRKDNIGKRKEYPMGRTDTKGLLDRMMDKSVASTSHEMLEDSASASPYPASILEAIEERRNAHTESVVHPLSNGLSKEPDRVRPPNAHEALEIRETVEGSCQEEMLDDEETEAQAEEIQEKEKSPSPKGLLPDFVFEPPDDAMFAELRAFLDQEDANSTVSSSDEDQEEESAAQEEYERRRLKKLRANEAILTKLGLGVHASPSPLPVIEVEEEVDEAAPRASPVEIKKKTNKSSRTIRIDADGTTTSLPPPGCTFEVAFVDVPVLRPRIRLQHIFEDDYPILPPLPDIESDEDEEVEQTTLPSRIASSQKTVKKRKPGFVRRGILGEALEGEGTTCHQCRRKTEEPKMRCRYHENGRVCPLFWCQRCLEVRYAIEWEEDSRTFHCPRCLAFCNCSLCLHKAGLSKIASGLGAKLRSEEGNKVFPSVKHYLDAKVGREVKIGSGGLPSGNWITVGKSTKEDTAEINPAPAKKAPKSAKKEAKRKMVDKASTIGEPVNKRQRRTKAEMQAARLETRIEELFPPPEIYLEGESSRSRKIKLTFKAKASAEEEEQKRQRRKFDKMVNSVNNQKVKKVQFAKSAPIATISTAPTARRGRPPNSSKKSVPHIIEAANVWVKSKADVAPSSSDSEPEDSTWRTISPGESDLSDLSDEEVGFDGNYELRDSVMHSDFDDGAEQDRDGEEEEEVAADSPQAGQVEFTHHPELTINHIHSHPAHPVFQNSGRNPFIEDVHAPFPPPNGPELTDFIQQLMGAGVI